MDKPPGQPTNGLANLLAQVAYSGLAQRQGVAYYELDGPGGSKSQVGEDSQEDGNRKTPVGSLPDIVTEVHQIQDGSRPQSVSGKYIILCKDLQRIASVQKHSGPMHNLISDKLTLPSSVSGGHLDILKSTILRLKISDSDFDFKC